MKYMGEHNFQKTATTSVISIISFSFFSHASFAQNAIAPDATLPTNTLVNFDIGVWKKLKQKMDERHIKRCPNIGHEKSKH